MRRLLKITGIIKLKEAFSIFVFLNCFLPFLNAQPSSFNNQVNSFTTHVKVEPKKLIVEHAYDFQVNNKSGDWIAEISIPYSTTEPVKDVEAWITDKQGILVRKLKKKDIIDKNRVEEAALYQDEFLKTFVLKHNTYPYKVHYRYKQVFDEFLIIDYWTPVIFRKTPTLVANLVVEVPINFKLHILQNGVNDPKMDTIEGNIIYKWTESSLVPIKEEVFSPQRRELIPKVIVVPEEFTYGAQGSFNNWITYGNWQCALNIGMDDLPLMEKMKVKNLTAGIDDPIEKARILYHYMQDNNRYINVSIDIGGLKPYPASYVTEKRYGDCKALSNYLKAILQEAGVTSYYTKIYADEKPIKIDTTFVGPQFNHIILFIPNYGDTIWLETTDRYNPFGYLGTFTQNRNAFAIIENESQLVRTPALSLNDVLEEKKVEIAFAPGSAVIMQFTEKLRGREFERLNALYHQYSEYEQKRLIPEYFIPLKSFELKEWKINKQKRDVPEIILDYTVKVDNHIKYYDGSQVIHIPHTRLPGLKKPDKRKYPIRINYPINRQDSVIYKIRSTDYKKIIVPECDTISSKYGFYTICSSKSEDQIFVIKKFQLYNGEYAHEEYEDFFNFFKAIHRKENKTAIILKN